MGAYNAPGTTDLGYDLYMPPQQFQDFIATLFPESRDGEKAGGSGVQVITEFHVVKHRGMLFALLLIARLFGCLLLLGGAAFLLAELLPEYKEDLPMVLVFLIPPASFYLLWTIIKAKGPDYRIQLSPEEITILRPGKAAEVSINLSEATVLPVNWVARGGHGRRRAGPALEFLYGNQSRTRIALSDPQDLWEEETCEISEPHYVISRQAWDALRAVVP